MAVWCLPNCRLLVKSCFLAITRYTGCFDPGKVSLVYFDGKRKLFAGKKFEFNVTVSRKVEIINFGPDL